MMETVRERGNRRRLGALPKCELDVAFIDGVRVLVVVVVGVEC